MTQLFVLLFSILLLATSADARSWQCRFHSSGKCKIPSYFKLELKNGCAAPGTRCRRQFCKTHCVDAKRGMRGLCKDGCLDSRTLNSLTKREREGLYTTVLKIGKNPSRKRLQRALRSEQELFSYRAKRSRGWFSWFRRQPSQIENLESLVLEGKLRQQYEELIRTENKKGNRKATVLALRAAAADIVPEPKELKRKKLAKKVIKKWRERIAKKRSETILAIAYDAGVSTAVADQAASIAVKDAMKGVKPKIPNKPAKLSALAKAHSKIPQAPPPPGGDYNMNTWSKRTAIPTAPPMPPAGWKPGKKPATAVGTVEDGATSANVIPPASSVGKGRAALFGEINQGKFKLKSAKDRKKSGGQEPKSRDTENVMDALSKKIKERRSAIEMSEISEEWSE